MKRKVKICSDVIIRDGEGNVKNVIPKATLQRAQKFATQRTKHENWLFSRLRRVTRKLQIEMFQQMVWHYEKTFYLVDIYIPAARLVIEVDGSSHNNRRQKERDVIRDKFFNDEGIRVVRVTNAEATHPLKEKTANTIANIIRSQLAKLNF